MTLSNYLKITLLLALFSILSLPLHAQDAPNAAVIDMAATLNLRQSASLSSPVIVELAGGTALIVFERSGTDWFHARTTDGQSGWLAARFVNLNADINSLHNVNPPAATDNAPTASTAPTSNTSSSGARVSTGIAGLNMRNSASLTGAIIGQLRPGTGVTIIGQNEAGTWLQIQISSGATGWVSGQFIETGVSATEGNSVITESSDSSASQAPAPSIITGDLASIYQRGLALGNFRNNFSKVGDSITASELFLFPIAYGQYNLGGFGHLQSVIDFFSVGDNSFAHNSLAAGPGWTTDALLNPDFANHGVCNAGEIPLECEYRITKPSVALIMIGTNDALGVSPQDYAGRLQRIVQITIDKGIIPVISTLPNRPGFEGQIGAYNDAIRAIAGQFGIPLWDYSSAMGGLYNFGISGDNLHPTQPSGGFADAANFTGDNLQSGFAVRNLTALQMLYSVWQAVLS